MAETALNFTKSKTPHNLQQDDKSNGNCRPLAISNPSSISGPGCDVGQGVTQRGLIQGALSVDEFERLANDYLLDCDYRLQSPRTVATRRIFIQNLLWFLRHRNYKVCGTSELRQFFAYLARGHEEAGGRWGQARYTRAVRPVTVKDYYVNLRCLFNWLVADGAIPVSPLDKIPKPAVRTEQVQPFSEEQIQALLKAARRSPNPKRDEAIVLFLYDTGVRASELCGLTMNNLDLTSRHAQVLGKGNKRRAVYFSRETAKLLSHYLRKAQRQDDDPVFLSASGVGPSAPLTRSGLLQLVGKLGKAAGIKGMKVSPHVFRHSAAIQLLRNGCDVYSLMSILGHTSLTVCQNYLKLSKLDVENQHRRYSPVDSLSRRKPRS